MEDLQFDILFNSISVISGQWADDNENVCAMALSCLWLGRFRLKQGSNPNSASRNGEGEVLGGH